MDALREDVLGTVEWLRRTGSPTFQTFRLPTCIEAGIPQAPSGKPVDAGCFSSHAGCRHASLCVCVRELQQYPMWSLHI